MSAAQSHNAVILICRHCCLFSNFEQSHIFEDLVDILKSIHWVNRSAQSSFFEKHIILTKPFQPTRADISCHSLKNISLCRTFSQWMGFTRFFFLWRSATFHSIKLPFDVQAAEKILKMVIYLAFLKFPSKTNQ